MENQKINQTINIETEGLSSVLKTSGLIVRKNSVPLFSNILFSIRGIVAINEFCTLIHDIKIDTPFDFGVSPDIFKIIKNKQDLEFQITDNFLSIKANGIKAKLNYVTDIDIDSNIPEQNILQNKFSPLPFNFMEGLKKTKVYSEGNNSLIPENYCFVIEKNSVYCTNSNVIIKFDFDNDIDSMTFPIEAYPILAAFEPEEYFVYKSFIYFKTNETFLCIKNIERTKRTGFIIDIFSEYKDIQDKNILEERKICLVDDFSQAILEASIFLSKENLFDGLFFHKEGNCLEIQSKNSKGQIKKECFFPDEAKIEDFEDFILSYKFLKPIANSFDFFIIEKILVAFFGDNITTIICKITE